MPYEELIAEIRSAAESLSRAAGLIEAGDLGSAEVGIEEALFRARSILSRMADMPRHLSQSGAKSTNRPA